MAPGQGSRGDRDAEKRYVTAWRATLKAMKSGDSISGHERNMAFLNRPAPKLPGGRGFADVSAISGLDFPDDARGLALVDWDRDGDLDMWLRNRSAPSLRLMMNQMTASENAGRFVALRVQGAEANRDGIGARVEITFTDGSLQARTLAAGSGFLSQSSKWLHFGIGEGEEIRSVVVRWPFGEREEFSGVTASSWWYLKQGEGAARKVEVKPQGTALPALPQALPVLDASRTLLAGSVPLPDLRYRTPEGELRPIANTGLVRLVIFWASGCPNCKAELRAMERASTQLKAAGIEVLAINIDEAIADQEADEKGVREFVEAEKFTFRWGWAVGSALHKIKHLEHALLDRDTELTVPYSCLLDRRGEVGAFYRGPIDADRWIRDASLLASEGDARRMEITGFGGRTFSQRPTRAGTLVELGIQFQDRFPLEAIRYLKMALPGKPDMATNPITRRIAGLYYVLGLAAIQKSNHTVAASHFSNCIEFRPDLLDARLNLSVALYRLGRGAEAISQLEALLKIDPAHAGALANLKVMSRQR